MNFVYAMLYFFVKIFLKTQIMMMDYFSAARFLLRKGDVTLSHQFSFFVIQNAKLKNEKFSETWILSEKTVSRSEAQKEAAVLCLVEFELFRGWAK